MEVRNNKINALLDKTLFPVREEPVPFVEQLIRMGPEDMARPNINYEIDTGFKMLIRDDTNEVISIVTNKYKLIKNYELLKTIDRHITKCNGVLTDATIFGNARTSYTITFGSMEYTVGNEKIMPRVIIYNSYDRTDSIKIVGGIFVLVCSNGMTVGTITESVSYTHILGRKIDEINDKIDSIIEGVIGFSEEKFPVLVDRRVQAPDLIKFMEIFPTNGKDEIINQFKVAKPKSFYDLLQIGTNVLTHKLNRNAEATHRLEQSFVNELMKLV